MASSRTWKTFALIALTVAVVDQVTKGLVSAAIPLQTGREAIPGLLDLVHVRNPGAAFGILAESVPGFRTAFFAGVSLIALAAILWLVATSPRIDTFLLLGYSLFFGGAVGNLVDRLRYGAVVDFLDFHVGSMHWPAFNVADSALTVGTGFFFLYVLCARGEGNEKSS
jgi:signal peptidase II